ncbi:unnamed protein product, partial [Heterotrigona itama]
MASRREEKKTQIVDERMLSDLSNRCWCVSSVSVRSHPFPPPSSYISHRYLGG